MCNVKVVGSNYIPAENHDPTPQISSAFCSTCVCVCKIALFSSTLFPLTAATWILGRSFDKDVLSAQCQIANLTYCTGQKSTNKTTGFSQLNLFFMNKKCVFPMFVQQYQAHNIFL